MTISTPHGLLKLACFLLSASLAGCGGSASFPHSARAGETVLLALTDTDDRMVGIFDGVLDNLTPLPPEEVFQLLQESKMQASIEDSAGAVHQARLGTVFRLYPDPTSLLGRGELAPSGDEFDGLWFAELSLTDPTTGAPLPLAPGEATISVTHTAGPAIAPTPDILVPAGDYGFYKQTIEILREQVLDSSGQLIDVFENPAELYGWFYRNDDFGLTDCCMQSQLRASSQIVYRVTRPREIGFDDVAGIEVELTYGHIVNQYQPYVTPLNSIDPTIQISAAQSDGPQYSLKVLIYSPNGFSADDQVRDSSLLTPSETANMLNERRTAWKNMGFVLSLDQSQEATITDANYGLYITVSSVKYYDIHGNEVAELTTAGLDEYPFFF